MNLRVLVLSMMFVVATLTGCSGRDVVARQLTERGAVVVGVNERGTELAVFPEGVRDKRVAAMQRLLEQGRREGWYLVTLHSDGEVLAAVLERAKIIPSWNHVAIAVAYQEWSGRIDITDQLTTQQRSQTGWYPAQVSHLGKGVFSLWQGRNEIASTIALRPWPTDPAFDGTVTASVVDPPEASTLVPAAYSPGGPLGGVLSIDCVVDPQKIIGFGPSKAKIVVASGAGAYPVVLDMNGAVSPVVLRRQE